MTEPPATVDLSDPADVDHALRRRLVDCWVEVTNAGGAVGFPRPPVATDVVARAVDSLTARLAPTVHHLVVAHDAVGVAGWVSLERNQDPLVPTGPPSDTSRSALPTKDAGWALPSWTTVGAPGATS